MLAVLTLASLIRSALGFGEALVAVPLLALIMPVQQAAPLAVMESITVAAIILLQDWAEVNLRTAGSLLVSSLFGVPLGVLVLTRVPESVVKAGLGALIVAFCLFSLLRKKQYELKSDRVAWIFGFGAGILGGAYGMNGPPLAVYGALRGFPPRQFRATLQGYFFPASIAVMASFWMAGLWTRTVTHYYLLSLPTVFVAVLIGRIINHRMHPRRFLLYVYVSLSVIGLLLLAQAFR